MCILSGRGCILNMMARLLEKSYRRVPILVFSARPGDWNEHAGITRTFVLRQWSHVPPRTKHWRACGCPICQCLHVWGAKLSSSPKETREMFEPGGICRMI